MMSNCCYVKIEEVAEIEACPECGEPCVGVEEE